MKFEDNNFTLDVRADTENETVWLTQDDIALLFDRDQGVISRHINNIFKEGELDKNTSMQKMHIGRQSLNTLIIFLVIMNLMKILPSVFPT